MNGNRQSGSIPKIERLTSDRLSHYRTRHDFLHYGEFQSAEEFAACARWAHQQQMPLLILGAGSNILFKKRQVRSLVLRNKLPKAMREIDACTLEASSSVMLAQVLKWCEERELDSFYYLASVPATVGGAVAMNAGRGRAHRQSIYDFIQSVTYLELDQPHTLCRSEIPVGHRITPFTGLQNKLILSAVFQFPRGSAQGRRQERISWSKEHQDHSLPNCGSVFRESNPRIMRRLRGVRFFNASYSSKTINWILNAGDRSWPIVWLIRLTQLIHLAALKVARVEVIEVD